jgi:endonuclease/exonuclease/phosphatase family metal-dependent hydrolase
MRTRQVFRVANAHLDNAGQLARKLALEQILKKVAADTFFGDVPIIVTGDFNMEPDWEEMQVLKEYPEFVNQTEQIGVTYHGYWKGDEQSSIDFIITRGAVRCEQLDKWTDQREGLYLSDHYPVCAELVLENQSLGER